MTIGRATALTRRYSRSGDRTGPRRPICVAYASRRAPPLRAALPCQGRARRRRRRRKAQRRPIRWLRRGRVAAASARQHSTLRRPAEESLPPTGIAMTPARHASERGQSAPLHSAFSPIRADRHHGQNEETGRDGEERLKPPRHRSRLSAGDPDDQDELAAAEVDGQAFCRLLARPARSVRR